MKVMILKILNATNVNTMSRRQMDAVRKMRKDDVSGKYHEQ